MEKGIFEILSARIDIGRGGLSGHDLKNFRGSKRRRYYNDFSK